MTFNPSVPNAAQSPGLFPAQNSTNFTRLKTIINADHVFNDTAQTTDGLHRQVTLINRATPVVLPAGSNGILYSKLDTLSATQLNFWNGVTNFQITPTMPIRAAVNFNEAGSIRSQFNVSSVTKHASGDYTVNFATNMPNTNYIVQVTGQREDSGLGVVCIGCIGSGLTFSGVATTSSVRVQFFGSSGTLQKVTAGCVTILSAT